MSGFLGRWTVTPWIATRPGFPWLEWGERLRPHVLTSPVARLEYVECDDEDVFEMFQQGQTNLGIAMSMVWSGVWAWSGFPQIVASHKLLASLGATSLAPECADLICVPWRSFSVVVPPGMLRGTLPDGREHDMTRIGFLQTDASQVRCVFFTSNGLGQWLSPVGNLREALQGDALVQDVGAGQVPLDSLDERSMRVGLRMVLGLCLELSSPEHAKPIADHARSISKRHGPPKVWTFNVRRDVHLDVRGAVADYIGGVGAPPSVQCLVRGHWKRQPCGHELQDRKWIQIEPYWRGPEDAPIAVRAHRVVP